MGTSSEDKGDSPDCWAAGLGGTGQPRAQRAKDGKEAAECTSWTEMLPPGFTQQCQTQGRDEEGGMAACLRKMYK